MHGMYISEWKCPFKRSAHLPIRKQTHNSKCLRISKHTAIKLALPATFQWSGIFHCCIFFKRERRRVLNIHRVADRCYDRYCSVYVCSNCTHTHTCNGHNVLWSIRIVMYLQHSWVPVAPARSGHVNPSFPW